MEHSVQVKEGHHNPKRYDNLPRFISYYHQIKTVSDLKPKNVLEIGIGNGFVSNYLKSIDIEVSTCDFDKTLNPDIISDIRDINAPDNSFDLVLAAEILEHLPFDDDLDKALSELARITKKHVVISIPYRSTGFEFVFKIPFIRTLFKRDFLDMYLRVPMRFQGFENSGQHYWEIDSRKYSLRRVKKKLEKYFIIKKAFSPVLNKYHYLFVLEKK